MKPIPPIKLPKPAEVDAQHQKMLNEIMFTGVGLTQWETTFIENIDYRFHNGFLHLSERQREILARIHNERVK
jgi:hypothetical protein